MAMPATSMDSPLLNPVKLGRAKLPVYFFALAVALVLIIGSALLVQSNRNTQSTEKSVVDLGVQEELNEPGTTVVVGQ